MKWKGYFRLEEERGVTALAIGCRERVRCAMGSMVGGGGRVGLGWSSVMMEGAGVVSGGGCMGEELTLGEWGLGVMWLGGVGWMQ